MFTNTKLIAKIRKKLPILFRIAEIENTRGGGIGMEVGNTREQIIIAILRNAFGKENVNDDIPTTEPSVDVYVKNHPYSIKTLTSKYPSGFKLIWTVDADKAKEFRDNYEPDCDIIYVYYKWGCQGGFCYIPISAQESHLEEVGRENYIKMPKPGTNPRGVEIQSKAVKEIVSHSDSKVITINWQKPEIDYDPIDKWTEIWNTT